MTGWSLVYEGFDPAKEGLREALCTLGNGYFATRGAALEAEADEIHYPGTYLAGVYNRLSTQIAGRSVENEDLVNFPNWLVLRLAPSDGDWFNPLGAEILDYRQELNVRRGLLTRIVTYRDRQGRTTTLRESRLVHMADPHLAAIRLEIVAENWEGAAILRGGLDGRVVNGGVERYRQLNNSHLRTCQAERIGDDSIRLVAETVQSRVRFAAAQRLVVVGGSGDAGVARTLYCEADFIAEDLGLVLSRGKPVIVEKTVAIFTSRDKAISECAPAAADAVARAPGYADLLPTHVEAWEWLWRRAAVSITDDGAGTELALRLHIFHLLQTYSPHSVDIDCGMPARGLHGEAYRGHVFWDELFIFPFYVFHFPELARAILMYRYRRLDAARRLARAAGLNGAMFPWQSGSDGREETQTLHLNPRSGRWLPDNSHLQRHVNAAIAYNVCHYCEITTDTEFASREGAALLVEIARMFASLASYNRTLERYEIRGVMGPDEYHDSYLDADEPGLNNNSYTNVMAVWVFTRALDLLSRLPAERRAELADRLGIDDEELRLWDDISRKMRVVFLDDNIISQFEGYDTLEEFDWQGYREKYGDISRLDRILEAEGDTPNRYRLSKQADALMLFYLFSSEQICELMQRLGYDFPPEAIPRNVEFYRERTSHGSTLSRVVLAWVLSRADRHGGWDQFRHALETDVSDVQGGTTKEGIHLGAMAATVDIVRRCYGGVAIMDGCLSIDPCLPKEARSLDMSVWYKGNRLDISVAGDSVSVTAGRGAFDDVEILLSVGRKTLKPGETLRAELKRPAT